MKSRQSGDIRLQQLVKTYGNQAVVNEISLHIPAGQFCSLLGPSGSGKTSTLMMIAGFSTADSGQIVIDGKDVSNTTPQQRALGMVFQNYALFPHLSVFENVAFPLRVRRSGRAAIAERVEWALEVTKLGEFSERYPRELSGGQQQRVALARAIVFHPQVVLMDEPLGALDKNLRYHMQAEIKEIQQRLGMTVVYVTHDQEEAMNMSDQIAIMNKGRIEQIGSPREVYENPQTEFVAKFLGEANLLVHRDAVSGGKIASGRGGNTLFIRPERISLTALDSVKHIDKDQICLPGKVRQVSFLGSIVRYIVDIDDSDTLIVDVQNIRSSEPFKQGEYVTASWYQLDGRTLQS